MGLRLKLKQMMCKHEWTSPVVVDYYSGCRRTKTELTFLCTKCKMSIAHEQRGV